MKHLVVHFIKVSTAMQPLSASEFLSTYWLHIGFKKPNDIRVIWSSYFASVFERKHVKMDMIYMTQFSINAIYLYTLLFNYLVVTFTLCKRVYNYSVTTCNDALQIHVHADTLLHELKMHSYEYQISWFHSTDLPAGHWFETLYVLERKERR